MTQFALFSTLVLLVPAVSFGNGLLDRAEEQYLQRDYTPAGIKSAYNAKYNFKRVQEKLINQLEGEFARARLLQAAIFLSSADPDSKQLVLQDAGGEAARSLFYFQQKFGRNPYGDRSMTDRGRKIYSDILYWKAEVFTELNLLRNKGYSSDLKRSEEEQQNVIEKGFGCVNGGGSYRYLGKRKRDQKDWAAALKYFRQAYQCTGRLEGIGNWNGWNTLNLVEALDQQGKREEAVAIAKSFLAQSPEQLAPDFIPENRQAQRQIAALLSTWKSGTQKSIPGEFVAKLRPEGVKQFFRNGIRSRAAFQWALGRELNSHVKELIDSDIAVLHQTPNESESEFIERMRKNDLVELIEPNYVFHISQTPNDPRLNESWGLTNAGQQDSNQKPGLPGVDVKAVRAWDISTGSREIIVGVIDTGVDFSHPDLKDNAWVNKSEATGKPGVDDDGNGYIDDINGYDFFANKGEVTDDHGHGTHVAGVIGAKGNDGIGIAGINWKVRIMALRFLGANGGGSLNGAVKAIRYATRMGARLTNNSWGGGDSSEILKAAIREANDAGILFVAAAGNSGENSDVLPEYPAAFDLPNIISVASVNNRGALSNFSNFGRRSVHIGAPGENILSTIPGGYASWSGTSMAAPYVSGVAALLLSKQPGLKAVQVKDQILRTSTPILALRNKTVSGGMVSAYGALTGRTTEDPSDPQDWESQRLAIGTQHPYPAGYRKAFELRVPGATLLTVRFPRFAFEPGYDRVFFSDERGRIVGTWTGVHNGEFSPIVQGEALYLHIVSDASIEEYGLESDQAFFKASRKP